MDSQIIKNAPVSDEDARTGELETESNNRDSLEVLSFRGDVMRDLENAGEVLTRVELDLACFSEKLLNLDVLVMHVAARESDFEAFVSEDENIFGDSAKCALVFDLLSGILESELKDLDNFVSTLQVEIDNASGTISSYKHLGEAFKDMQEKLMDCEKSLKQSLEQVLEMKAQSDNFQRLLYKYSGVKHGKDSESLENGYSSDLSSKIKMQTAEQQRHILRMFEKSLARELDLEKKVTDLRQSEEILKLRLQQEAFSMEEEVEIASEKLFEAANFAEVLHGTSRELMGQLQILKFNLNGFVQRELEMRSKCQELSEQLSMKDLALQKSESINAEPKVKSTAREKQVEESELHSCNLKDSAEKESDAKIHELEDLVKILKEQLSEAGKRADSAEAESKLLKDTNAELNKDLSLLKTSNASALEAVELLKRQLKESDIQLQHAVASVEASQEKETMLYSTVEDMENLIKDLKSKVSKAESRTESAEEKCIILSESNQYLNEELNFLRSKIESLEASLNQAEETKRATAKDIGFRTKLIRDLIMQLALERERLHKQVSVLMMEKKILSESLQQMSKDHSLPASKGDEEIRKVYTVSMNDFAASETSCKENKSEASEILETSHELDKADKDVLSGNADEGQTEATSKLDTVRNIDARQLNCKYVVVAVLVLVISGFAASFLQHPSFQI